MVLEMAGRKWYEMAGRKWYEMAGTSIVLGGAAPVRRHAEIHQWIPHSLLNYYLHRGNDRVVVDEALCA